MIRIIPAIDIIDGKCVRLSKGDYAQQRTYNAAPLDMAMQYEDVGLKYLHLVDLDGAREKKIINHNVLESITSKTSLIVDFGGGIRTDEDVRIAFECGAAQINVGSVAIKEPKLFRCWAEKYGSEKIILSADVKEDKIAISGWTEGSEKTVYQLIESLLDLPLTYVICTDISKDGMLEGPSFELYKKIIEQFPDIRLIASGGVTSLNDIEKLNESGCFGVIIGKAIYEGRIKLQEFKVFV